MSRGWMFTLWGLILLLAATEAWSIYDRHRAARRKAEGKARYLGTVNVMHLPAFFCLFLPLLLLLTGWENTGHAIFSLGLSLFLQISLYYLLLLLLLPVLRRRFSAVACAELWLLPNMLYLVVQMQMNGSLSWTLAERPLLVLPWLRGTVTAAVWAAGALAVLGWKILSHILFRRRILKNAREEGDSAVLAVWYAEQRAAGRQDWDLPLIRSSCVSTPLSIGLFPGTLKVVLPERNYTEEELALVLRHELIHIGRRDNVGKFFLVFCTALCWFNPLMWIAMRRSAEDMELSCDETVLLDGDAASRRRYGELLLSVAGDERGFTTCLSASARSLRYRLSRVMRPQKRLPGAVLAGALLLLLLFSTAEVMVAYDRVTWAEAVGGGEISKVHKLGSETWTDREVSAEAAEYLRSLPLSRTTAISFPPDTETELLLSCQRPFAYVAFSGELVEVLAPGWIGKRVYYCPGGPDWDYMRALFSQ